MTTVAQENGNAIFTCKNHPNLRWTKTKHGPGFIGRGTLLFNGEEGGNPGAPFTISERDVATYSEEHRKLFLKSWTPECNCSIGDLEFLRWA